MMAALPDAIVFKTMDQYKDGLHARMDARAARMRDMFGELMSALRVFEFYRDWDANGLNNRLMWLNDVCEDMPDDSVSLREALDELWDIV